MSSAAKNWTPKRKVEFRLYPQQAEFRRSTALFRGFVGGRGAGKSKVGAYDAIVRMQPGRLYEVVSPTYKELKDATFRSFKEILAHLGLSMVLNKTDMTARLSTGAEVLFRSASDPDTLRGPNLSGVWLDEASLMERDAFDVVIACLREGGQMGWLSATFTPKGRLHWTYEVFGPDRRPGTHLVHAASEDNPFIDRTFYETIRLQYSGLRGRQELGGEFVNVEGAEWPAEYFDGEELWFDDWPKGLYLRTIALDPSKGKGDTKPKKEREHDYSAFAMLGIHDDGTLWVEGDLDNVRDIDRIIKDGLIHYRLFQPDGFGVETNQFQVMMKAEFERQAAAEQLLIPTYGLENNENKQMRIRRLTPYLAQRKMRFRRTKGTRLLFEQLRAFPETDHDDGPDALEMAVRLAGWLVSGSQSGQAVRLKG